VEGGRGVVLTVVVVAVAEAEGGGHLRGLRAAVRSWMLCFLAWGLGLLVRRGLESGGRSSALGGGDRVVVDDSSDQDRRFMCAEEPRDAKPGATWNC
jgi:hypothetical protein